MRSIQHRTLAKVHIYLEKCFILPYNDRKIAKGAMKNDSSSIQGNWSNGRRRGTDVVCARWRITRQSQGMCYLRW